MEKHLTAGMPSIPLCQTMRPAVRPLCAGSESRWITTHQALPGTAPNRDRTSGTRYSPTVHDFPSFFAAKHIVTCGKPP